VATKQAQHWWSIREQEPHLPPRDGRFAISRAATLAHVDRSSRSESRDSSRKIVDLTRRLDTLAWGAHALRRDLSPRGQPHSSNHVISFRRPSNGVPRLSRRAFRACGGWPYLVDLYLRAAATHHFELHNCFRCRHESLESSSGFPFCADEAANKSIEPDRHNCRNQRLVPNEDS
jgi:hypothetical protein